MRILFASILIKGREKKRKIYKRNKKGLFVKYYMGLSVYGVLGWVLTV